MGPLEIARGGGPGGGGVAWGTGGAATGGC